MNQQSLLFGLQVGVLLWLSLWSLRVLRELAKGQVASASIAILIHFIFVGVPLGFDLTGNLPDYRFWPTYRYSSEDYQTNLIFLVYMAICPPIWWYTTKKQRMVAIQKISPRLNKEFHRYLQNLVPFFWLILISPLVLLMFAPDPFVYLDYAAIVREEFAGPTFDYHLYISTATTVALLAAASLLYAAKRVWPMLVVLSPFVICAMWLNGKRACVVIWLLLLVIVLRMRGQLQGFRLILACSLALGIFVGYSFTYQSRYRSNSVLTMEAAYQNYRIDFGRDQGIKMAIYGELNPQYVQILEYRGQSLLFDMTFFVPRSAWPDKPWPYAVYSTAAALNFPMDYIGWGVTTSILEEAVANFSWLGLILGPLMISLVIRLGESTGEPMAAFLTRLIVVLLLTVQMAAWLYLAILWVLAVVRARRIYKLDQKMARKLGLQARFGGHAPVFSPRPGFRPRIGGA